MSDNADINIGKSSYLRGRIGWQGLRADEFIDDGPHLVTGTDFLHGQVDWGTCYHVSEKRFAEAAYIHVRDGDLLITKDGTIGKVAYANSCPEKAVLNSGIFLLRCKDGSYLHRYAYYVLTSFVFGEFLGRNLNGSTINHLYQHVFVKFELPYRPFAEQQKIAAILTSIDTTIEKTEALIEKYQQIKAGLMHDLFTRGVLPNGQLRPPRDQAPELYQETAIGWIPAGWRVEHLGRMAKIVSGVTLGAKEGPSDTIDAPYLRVANVQDGYLDLNEIKTVRISRKTLEYLRLQVGDVLMNEGGDFDKLGRGAVWAGEIADCLHQNHVFRVRVDASILLPQYLAFYSESSFGKKYFLLSSKQSTNLASINSTQLNAYPIASPSLLEQQAIVQRLNEMNRRIDAMKTECSKLRNQKLGLMQDLLTGKVPVKVGAGETANHGERHP